MKRLVTLIALLTSLTLIGTIGFRLLTGADWIECLYVAMVTLTTVGSRELPNLSTGGMLFTIVYLVCGLGVFSYSAFQLGSVIVNAELRGLWEKRRMQKQVDQIRDHYIICGLGRMGGTIGEYLQNRGKEFVVIDSNRERLESVCRSRGWLFIEGDATHDEVLKAAGIERAKSLACVLATDADNVYVVLSARMLNSAIQIVSRASDEKSVEKIERAGASRVISPFSSGATKMARFMINPNIEDFLEVADAHGNGWELTDLQIAAGSPYIGKILAETDFRERGVMVIGIRREDGERLMPPPGSAEIRIGDSLFAFGSVGAVNEIIGESNGG